MSITLAKMQACLDTLNEIAQSGYWPFASPAPCSTEVKIKEGIDKARTGLESAIYWHCQEFEKHNRVDNKPTNFKLV